MSYVHTYVPTHACTDIFCARKQMNKHIVYTQTTGSYQFSFALPHKDTPSGEYKVREQIQRARVCVCVCVCVRQCRVR